MLNEIYNRRILELAASIPHLGRLASPDASATARSRLCGKTSPATPPCFSPSMQSSTPSTRSRRDAPGAPDNAGPRPAGGALGNPGLSTQSLRACRPRVPPSAVLLRIHRRGDPAPRLLARRLDGLCPDLPLRALRHLGARSGA